MPLGYTASFSTSHLRPYTGPPALVGATFYGTGGIRGPRGSAGPVGLSGPSGPTGMKLIGTYLQLDPTKPAYNYYVLEFADGLGNYVTAAPRGLTGTHGPVWNGVTGATAYFYNTKECDAPVGPGLNAPCGFTGILSGFTYISPTYRPWGGHYGQSGATLSFRTIGVSGDLELYAAGNIGTGDTFDVLGISGPDAAVQYGTVTLQSENEIVYLTNSKNVKDSYGLTFNPPHPITSSGSGTTWGTVDVRFHNHSEHFYIHGNAIDGVVKDPFVIDLKEGYGNVHQIFAPFSLSGISAEFHPSKNPIVSGPNWLAPNDWPLGGFGSTAEFGEAISITMLIDGGPFGIEFSKDFYFSEDVKFTNGRDIINCLSYDHCNSWFCTMAGIGFGASVLSDSYGSCCNENFDCQEYMKYDDCIAQWEHANWYEETPCEDTPCGKYQDIGSCCINIDSGYGNLCVDENVNKSDCERFGGSWRQGTLCSTPCSNPCGDVVGACCHYGADGQFEFCENETAFVDCEAVGGSWQGADSHCSTVNCSGSISQGACCLSATQCNGPVSPSMCVSMGGSYQGNGTECASVDCDCCAVGLAGNGESNEVIFKQRIMSQDRLPKLSGTVFNDKEEFDVSSVYEYVVEHGVDSIRKFVPHEFDVVDLSTISICLGCDRNLLGKDCIILVVPVGAETAVAEAFGGVAYIGKSCEEVNCKERHGTNLIHTDMVVGKSLMGMNTTSTGKCNLKDGTIIKGCDENYCVNALGGRWKKNNIPPNQKWVMTPSGGQSRKK